jgi:ABC-type transporter Mla subunit MlaD
MRRLLLLSGLAASALASGLVLALSTGAQGSSSGTFYVIFDDARGLIAGQLVKVAGAKAGTIENVTLTRDYKARIQASIGSQFLPFHQDASCTIRPQGLIAENYVECDPGTANSPALRGPGGAPPVVPVTHTTEPVSLQDLFNIFDLPTRERIAVLIDELGIGTAAEGSSFNEILRRANPALQLADQAISILSRQRAQLAQTIDATDRIAAQAAAHTGAVKAFVQRAAQVSRTTAGHHGQLSEAIARLPGLLAQAQPALASTDEIARNGAPLLGQLRAAAPFLDRVDRDLEPFVQAALPGLDRLAGAIRVAIPAIHAVTPVLGSVHSYLKRSLPTTKLFARLSENLQRHGFVENFLSVAYYVGAALARHDSISHVLSVLLVGPGPLACGNYATTPLAGCSRHYGTQSAYAPSRAARRMRAAHRGGVASGQRPGAVPRAGRSATTPAASPSSPAPGVHPAPLLGSLGQTLGKALGGTSGPAQGAGQALQNLLSYLLR